MPDDANETLADTPRDAAGGAVKPQSGPLDRAGTEAEARVGGDRTPPESGVGTPAGQHNAHAPENLPEPPGKGPGHDTEEAAAYRENDA